MHLAEEPNLAVSTALRDSHGDKKERVKEVLKRLH